MKGGDLNHTSYTMEIHSQVSNSNWFCNRHGVALALLHLIRTPHALHIHVRSTSYIYKVFQLLLLLLFLIRMQMQAQVSVCDLDLDLGSGIYYCYELMAQGLIHLDCILVSGLNTNCTYGVSILIYY
jgi:hypothetical protein